MAKKIRRSSKGGYYHNMPHDKYWKQRGKEKLSESFAKADDVSAYIEGLYKNCLIDFCKDYEKLLKPFTKDGKVVLADLRKAMTYDTSFQGKYNRLLTQINMFKDVLGKPQQKEVLSLLKTVYKDTVISTYRDMGVPTNGCELLHKKAIETAVKQPFTKDGREFSDRIWDNLGRMQDKLRDTLSTSVAKGESIQKTTRKFKTIMGNTTYNTQRLIRTETIACYSKASQNSYKELGVKQMKILAEQSDVCDVCASYDGDIISVEDAELGLDIPPFHPNCKCCVVPVIE